MTVLVEPFASVYDDRSRLGVILARGRSGLEAYAADDHSLGLFPSLTLADLPSQSYRRHRMDGPVPAPDDFISAVVRIAYPATQSTQTCVAGCNRASERRMASRQLTEAYGWRIV